MTHQYMEIKLKELEKRIEALEQPCGTCKHEDETDGSNCYECVKGMKDGFEPKTGHWIQVDDKADAFDCSECDAMVSRKYNYCPNCGSKMAESEE